MKLSRAEERLFGNESPGQQSKRSRDGDNANGAAGSPTNSVGSGSGSKDRFSRASDDGCKEMDQLLQRLLSAEEEMKREHDLLTALDKKQKLIEAQEQKVSTCLVFFCKNNSSESNYGSNTVLLNSRYISRLLDWIL